MKQINYSDLFCERMSRYLTESSAELADGESVFEYGKYDTMCERYEISSDDTAKALGLTKGRYALVTLPEAHVAEDKVKQYYVRYFAKYLRTFFDGVPSSVLVVGLGNRHISADSLGTKVCSKITVTRSLSEVHCKVSAIAPSVLGLTGIESSDIVSAVVDKIKPQYVVVVDSLCAGSVDRLGCSFQINNCPIHPGGGVGNKRKVVSGGSASIVTIGVPLVVYGTTFVDTALSNSGISKNVVTKAKKHIMHSTDNEQILDILSGLQSLPRAIDSNLVVTLKDIEQVVDYCADIIAQALNMILLG